MTTKLFNPNNDNQHSNQSNNSYIKVPIKCRLRVKYDGYKHKDNNFIPAGWVGFEVLETTTGTAINDPHRFAEYTKNLLKSHPNSLVQKLFNDVLDLNVYEEQLSPTGLKDDIGVHITIFSDLEVVPGIVGIRNLEDLENAKSNGIIDELTWQRMNANGVIDDIKQYWNNNHRSWLTQLQWQRLQDLEAAWCNKIINANIILDPDKIKLNGGYSIGFNGILLGIEVEEHKFSTVKTVVGETVNINYDFVNKQLHKIEYGMPARNHTYGKHITALCIQKDPSKVTADKSGYQVNIKINDEYLWRDKYFLTLNEIFNMAKERNLALMDIIRINPEFDIKPVLASLKSCSYKLTPNHH